MKRGRKKIRKKELIKDLQRVALMLGHYVSERDYSKYGAYSRTTMEGRFGSWSRALKAAHLPSVLANFKVPYRCVGDTYFANGTMRDTGDKLGVSRQTVSTAVRTLGLKAKHWRVTPKDIIDGLKELSNKLGRRPTQAEFSQAKGICVTSLKNRFRSWDNAIKRAGLSHLPRKERLYPTKITTDDLIKDLKRAKKRANGHLTIFAYKKFAEFHFMTYVRRFGSWNKGKKAAGLPIASGGCLPKVPYRVIADTYFANGTMKTTAKKLGISQATVRNALRALNLKGKPPASVCRYTPEPIISELKTLAKELDRQPTRKEFRDKTRICPTTIRRHLKTWGRALKLAKIQQLPMKKGAYNIPDSVLIQDLIRAKRLAMGYLTISTYRQFGTFHPTTFHRRFGSWTKAKELIA